MREWGPGTDEGPHETMSRDRTGKNRGHCRIQTEVPSTIILVSEQPSQVKTRR